MSGYAPGVRSYAEAPIPKIWLTLFTITSSIAAIGTGIGLLVELVRLLRLLVTAGRE